MVAKGFGLKGPRGWAFRGVTVDVAPGALVTIEGPSGSGRTCLLLALTGRMRATEGHAEVGGLALPRKMAAVRRISALGPVPGVSDLDPALTVAEHLRERALLQRRFDGSPLALLRPRAERAAASRARIEAALETAGLDLDTLPKGERTSVRDLERLEALRLSIALALIGEPRLLAVDDTDLKLSGADRAEAWSLLRSISDGGTTVLAVCAEAPGGTTAIRTDGANSTDGSNSTDGTDDANGTDASRLDEAKNKPAEATTDETEPDESEPDQAEPDETDPDQTDADETETETDSKTTTNTDSKTDTETETEKGAADALAETGRA